MALAIYSTKAARPGRPANPDPTGGKTSERLLMATDGEYSARRGAKVPTHGRVRRPIVGPWKPRTRHSATPTRRPRALPNALHRCLHPRGRSDWNQAERP